MFCYYKKKTLCSAQVSIRVNDLDYMFVIYYISKKFLV